MKRRRVDWIWEDLEAQAVFAEWVGFPDEAATASEVDAIERFLHLRQGAKVLDVGCGIGRHAIELASRGHLVVGIDIAESYLEQAERAVARAGVSVELRRQRASEIAEQDCFDAALAINFTLGFLQDAELAAQFKAIAGALRPDGKLLLKTAGPQWLPDTQAHPVKNWGERDGRFILSEKRMEGRTRIEHNVVIDTSRNEIVEYHERQRAFSRVEVLGMLKDAGFVAVKCFQDLSGRAANDERFGVYVGKA